MSDEDDKSGSPAHDLDSKQRRKDELKREIHRVNLNPMGTYTDESGNSVYGYNIVLGNLDSLYSEISDLLSKEEQEEIQKIKTTIDILLNIDSPMYQSMTREVTWFK